jgi:MFS family permease
MACTEGWEIGLLGSMYFVGWVSSLILISRLADKIGRRMLLLGSVIAQCITFVLVIFCQSLTFMIVLMFVSGCITGVRMSLGYVYMMEFC